MPANYLYILILVIVLIYIQDNSSWLIPENIPFRTDPNKKVVIAAYDRFIKTNFNTAIEHMMLLKNNLTLLNKSKYMINDTNINQIHNLIKKTETDLAEFKHINGFTNDELHVDSHLEHTLKGSRFDNNISKSDVYSDVIYEKYCTLNTIIDINIVILLLEHGHHKGYLKLDNLYELIKIYTILTKSKDYLSYDELFGQLDASAIDPKTGKFNLDCPKLNMSNNSGYNRIIDYSINDSNNYYNTHTKDYGVEHNFKAPWLKYKNQYEFSQMNKNIDLAGGVEYANEELIPIFDKSVSIINPARNDNNSSHNTQYLYDSGTNINITRDNIQPYIPLCDINKIRTDKERLAKILYDRTSPKMLRNDYDF
ncbi:MAG: hypothetical protein ACRCZI_04640 [Cetobacterium sp.]